MLWRQIFNRSLQFLNRESRDVIRNSLLGDHAACQVRGALGKLEI